jgi:hypothetical protein
MSTENNIQTNPSEGIVSSRELIVIVKPDAKLRTDGTSVASRTGADTTSLNELLGSEAATLNLLFGSSEDRLEEEATAVDGESEASVPGLSTYYHVQADDDKLDGLAAQLREQELVEAAYIKPAAEVAVMTTSSFRAACR